MVELRTVAPAVEGSNPSTHPKNFGHSSQANIRDRQSFKLFHPPHRQVPLVFAKRNMGTYARESGFSNRSQITYSQIDTRLQGSDVARLLRKLGNLWMTMVTSNAPFTAAAAYVAALIMHRVSRSVGQ